MGYDLVEMDQVVVGSPGVKIQQDVTRCAGTLDFVGVEAAVVFFYNQQRALQDCMFFSFEISRLKCFFCFRKKRRKKRPSVVSLSRELSMFSQSPGCCWHMGGGDKSFIYWKGSKPVLQAPVDL